MTDLKSYRQLWNQRQKELRRCLSRPEQHEEAIQLFLSQHAMLHTQELVPSETWSFEDEVFRDATEAQIRRLPRNCAHSVAWCIWHLARIEDVALNMLVAGKPQILDQDDWLERMRTAIRHTGNAMDDSGIADLSARIDIEALRAYRRAVGRRTREIVVQLSPEALKRKVDPSCLQRVRDEGAVVEAAWGIVDYWGRRDIAGLLLMPLTRHNMVHLNEALRLKQRRS
jgi:hypothetical protein